MTVLEALKANNWTAMVEGVGIEVPVAGVVQIKRGLRVAECALLRDYPHYSVNALIVVDGKPIITNYALGITVFNGYSSCAEQVAAIEKAEYVLDKPVIELLAVA